VDELAGRCVTVGQWVRVTLPGETLQGSAVGLADTGHLLVETAGGRREIAAGDVVSLRPAGPGDPAGPGGSGSLN
jgi:BirA family biotin operon repressor/biotin-[acetyl-CoA-carboxylase] ligase